MTDLLAGPLLRADHDAAMSRLAPVALRRHGSHPACVSDGRSVTYAQLADLVDDRRVELGEAPSLVTLHGTNTLDFVVTYLAALDGRHPVIVASDERSASSLAERFEVDVSFDATGADAVRIERLERPERTTWHADLAVMMSTSGSTGSPKLVRLTLDAVTSNAVSIASSLGLRSDDCAITSLPLHYCYGLSVVTSHLVVGATIVLTDASVVDPCFWSAVDTHGVTTVAGVPHTFDLLDRLDDEVLAAPSLRRLTQAGGRLPVDAVERWAQRGRRQGWELFVMYGQTEATARMACLESSGVLDAPASVGRAIPGGSFRIDPVEDGERGVGAHGVGEVVYRGPNVMMGYATRVEDLRRGSDLDELRTGDLGRFDADGRLEIVGRLNRFVKLHGKRVDLDHLELELSEEFDAPVHATGDDDGVVVALVDPETRSPHLDDELRATVAERIGVPAGRVTVLRLDHVPVTGSGKIDRHALEQQARAFASDAVIADAHDQGASVADVFATVLGARPDSAASFARLGGDSFTYVEMSIRLESVLGSLPQDWHLRSVAELETLRRRRPSSTTWQRWSRSVDTSVVIRAVGILLIVCTHMRVFRLAGGAHALLAVVGYNVARFQLLPHEVPDRVRRALATIARIAIPTSAWIGLNMLLAGGYSIGAMLLVNNYTGSGNRTDGRWEYWYFEAFVQIMIVLAVVFSVGRVRSAERARPLAFALGVLGVTWLFRFEIVNLGGAYNEIFRPHTVACFVALGWCAQRAATFAQRLLVSVCAIVTTLGYFETVGRVDQLDRELRILAAVLALVWIRSVRLPTPLAMLVGKIAAASMWIFLVHWQVWPLFTPWMDDRGAFLCTIAVGVAVWWAGDKVGELIGELRQRRIDGRSTNSQVSSAETAIRTNDVTPVSA